MRVHFLLLLPKIEVPYSYALIVGTRVKEFPTGMQGEVADPVIVASECMEQLAGLTQEELDKFITASRQDKCLEIIGNAIGSFFTEFLKGVHSDLRGEFMFEELRVH
jgi:hypothetical protein